MPIHVYTYIGYIGKTVTFVTKVPEVLKLQSKFM